MSTARFSPTLKSETKIELQTKREIDKMEDKKVRDDNKIEVVKMDTETKSGKSARAEALEKYQEILKSETAPKTEVSKSSTLPRKRGSI